MRGPAVLVGVDIVETDRISRAVSDGGAAYGRRVTTPAERELHAGSPLADAASFAVKESFIKAVGGRSAGFSWHDFEEQGDERAEDLAWAAPLLAEAASTLHATTGLTLTTAAPYRIRGASRRAALARLAPRGDEPPVAGAAQWGSERGLARRAGDSDRRFQGSSVMSLVQATGETVVKPGESIQRALDEAGPGATIRLTEATYSESLWIRHSGVTLLGEGPELTRLVPGDVAEVGIPQLHDATSDVISGISVYGEGIRDITVRGLSVHGFSGSGVYAHTVEDIVLDEIEARDNDYWGLYVRESSGCEIRRCRASGSQYAGIALSFCPEANALIADNETFGNAFGIFVDNSSRARMLRNTCHGNSAGLLLLNQIYEGELPGGVNDCLVADNELRGNRLVSGEGSPDGLGEAGPPISGVGLALIGVHRVTVVGNRIHDNHPGGFSIMGGAFVLASSKEWGGDESLDNHISWNEITGNTPLDVQIDADFDRQGIDNNLANASAPETIRGFASEETR